VPRIAALIVLVLAGCSANSGLGLDSLEAESILSADIPGLSNDRVTDRQNGSSPMITQLSDVAGSWEAASVEIAHAVRRHGWTVDSINCVGTGNDVIAKKQIEGQWVLLESGAGTRGAGIILRLAPTQQAPGSVDIDSRCSAALIAAVS